MGSVRAGDFGSFIIDLINENKFISENLKNTIFYMDNARIHNAKILQPLFSKLNIFYSAPYSPFLNPIEEFFGNLKHIIRK
jgi:hypothetical protein